MKPQSIISFREGATHLADGLGSLLSDAFHYLTPFDGFIIILHLQCSYGISNTFHLSELKLAKVDDSGKIRFLTDDQEARLRAALDERETRLRQQCESGNHWRRMQGYDVLPTLELASFTHHLKPMVLLSINTGLRQGELFNIL